MAALHPLVLISFLRIFPATAKHGAKQAKQAQDTNEEYETMTFVWLDTDTMEAGEHTDHNSVSAVVAEQCGTNLLIRVTETAECIYAVAGGRPEIKLNGPFPRNADIYVDVSHLEPGPYTLYARGLDGDVFAYGDVEIG